MGLFRPKQPPEPPSQPPDEKAAEAAALYGRQQFLAAFETYVAAIDKLHTMYVMGQAQVRKPGQRDDVILTGVDNALGATLAMNPQAAVDSPYQTAVNYLNQITGMAGAERDRYL